MGYEPHDMMTGTGGGRFGGESIERMNRIESNRINRMRTPQPHQNLDRRSTCKIYMYMVDLLLARSRNYVANDSKQQLYTVKVD
jgi:hypothetical protein